MYILKLVVCKVALTLLLSSNILLYYYHQGMGIHNVMNNYDSIHSIELSQHWYQVCIEKFKMHDKVHIHHGDSKFILPEFLMTINEPVTVHLDAHYSGGLTAFGEEVCNNFL